MPSGGNGAVDPGEECDDANVVTGDGCERDCSATPSGSVSPSLRVERAPGGQTHLRWGSSCLTTDHDFEIYEGEFPLFASHVPLTCSTGGSQAATITPQAYSTFYLVVPRNLHSEGSYGVNSDGVERAPSAQALP